MNQSHMARWTDLLEKGSVYDAVAVMGDEETDTPVPVGIVWMLAADLAAMRTRNATLTASIDELTARIAAIEATPAHAPSVTYAGVFSDTKTYRRGDLITKAGGLWLALNDAAPGQLPGSSPHYKLIVKSGGAL